MIKKNLKTLIITSIVILIPIFIGLFLWNRLPDEIPIHWNVYGEVDDWGHKSVAVFVLPLFLLLMHWICVLATSKDPKNQANTEKPMLLVLWITPILSVALSTIIYITALGNELPINTVISMILGLVFVVIGNYLPKCKQSYTIGIRIPWTLKSEENWNKTHRLAGWVWVVCGLIILVCGFFNLLWLALPFALIVALVPIIYSFILHKKGI